MMLIMFYTVVAFGLAYCLGASKLSLLWRSPLAALAKAGRLAGTDPLKLVSGAVAAFFLALIECPACTGFWIGVAFARHDLARELLGGSLWITGWLWGFWTVATNLILARLAGITAQEGEP